MQVSEMKKIACEAIDAYADRLIALESSIYHEPELGYKEFKTAAKIKAALGIEHMPVRAKDGLLETIRSFEE